MKKIFIFSLALAAGITANAQSVYSVEGDSWLTAQGSPDPTATYALTAGTQVMDNDDFTVTLGADDSYKAVSVAFNGFNKVSFGGQELDCSTNGIQGNSNPKDASGGNCQSTFSAPASGAFFKLQPKKDGYIYVVHKASSNKNYVVFEDVNCLAYEFAMNIAADADKNADPCGDVLYYNLPAADYGYYDQSAGPINWPIQIYHNSTDATSAGNGVGVIKFPVYLGSVYTFNAMGSKMSLKGICYSAKPVDVTLIGANEDGSEKSLTLLSADGGTGIAGVAVESASDVNAPAYNIAGQRVNLNAKGLIIVNGKKYINK